MSEPKIRFAHANGFPARTYSKLFSDLAADFDIGYLERHGHDPESPVSDNWEFLRAELRVEIRRRYKEGKLARLSFMKKHFPVDFFQIEVSHLFPSEKPVETAASIKAIIKCCSDDV